MASRRRRSVPFTPVMRISGYGGGTGYTAPAATRPAAAPAVRSAPKPELKVGDGFASTQLPPGVGETLDIKA